MLTAVRNWPRNRPRRYSLVHRANTLGCRLLIHSAVLLSYTLLYGRAVAQYRVGAVAEYRSGAGVRYRMCAVAEYRSGAGVQYRVGTGA